MRLVLLTLLIPLVAALVHAEEKNDHLPSDCGRFLEYKFFEGNETEFDDFPWLVLLDYDTPRGRYGACGGVILSSRYVLTAAHCVANLGGNWTLSSVRIGEYDTSAAVDCLPEGDANNTTFCMPESRSIKIEKIIVHEKYDTRMGRGHDIALLRLAEDIIFTEFIRPICLPKKDHAEPQKFHAAGWGKLAGRRGSERKLRSYVRIMDNTTVCKEAYKGQGVVLAEDQICAGDRPKEHPCVADSGGPLMGVEKMADGSYKMAVFALLTTDSRFCDIDDWPAAYTDVLKYRSWVLQHTK